jgi:hypothetical protein
MADLRNQAKLHLAWWRRENARPVVQNWFPLPLPAGGLDIDVPPSEIADRKLRNAEAQHASPALQDSLVTAGVNFATALYPAAAGCRFRFDRHTSWTLPCARRARDVRIPPFDPAQPLYAAYIERLQAVLARWAWDTYLPVAAGHAGPGDMLAAFLGPETLAVELYEAPDDVHAAARAATDFICEAVEFEKRLFRSAGVSGGTATSFNTFQPGYAGLFVEDFTALVGPDHYREFFLEHDRRIVRHFDSVLFHTHSAGFRNIAPMLQLPPSVAFEFGNDPKGPDLPQRIRTVQSLLADGRPTVFGSWNIPLPRSDVDLAADALPAPGLNLRFQCASAPEALELYHHIKNAYPPEPT